MCEFEDPICYSCDNPCHHQPTAPRAGRGSSAKTPKEVDDTFDISDLDLLDDATPEQAAKAQSDKSSDAMSVDSVPKASAETKKPLPKFHKGKVAEAINDERTKELVDELDLVGRRVSVRPFISCYFPQLMLIQMECSITTPTSSPQKESSPSVDKSIESKNESNPTEQSTKLSAEAVDLTDPTECIAFNVGNSKRARLVPVLDTSLRPACTYFV